jgi:holo-[acyl-carrier protein] synthase
MPVDNGGAVNSSVSLLAQWTVGGELGRPAATAASTWAPDLRVAPASLAGAPGPDARLPAAAAPSSAGSDSALPAAAAPALSIAAQLAAMPAPAAIASIGVDLLRIDRVERALAKRGERFAAKILGPEEMAKFRARSARDAARGVRFLATRFAAKEAFSKAIGLGMRMPMSWRRVQTLNAPGGRPVLVVAEPLRSWYVERFGAAHVSITDESDMAVAYVVVERLPQAP